MRRQLWATFAYVAGQQLAIEIFKQGFLKKKLSVGSILCYGANGSEDICKVMKPFGTFWFFLSLNTGHSMSGRISTRLQKPLDCRVKKIVGGFEHIYRKILACRQPLRDFKPTYTCFIGPRFFFFPAGSSGLCLVVNHLVLIGVEQATGYFLVLLLHNIIPKREHLSLEVGHL